MRLRSIPQSVSNRLAPYRASFKCTQAQHFNLWCWLLVSLLVSTSGQLKALTRCMPHRLAYWTTLRMIRSKVWDEQVLIELLVGEVLHTLPPPRDGILHLIPDTTRKEKTGEKQPLAFTTKTGKFEPYRFGHSVVLLIAQWGGFRVPIAVRVLDPKIRGHQNLLAREMLRQVKLPTWCQQVMVEADAGFAAKQTLGLITQLGYFYVFALPRTWKLADGPHLSNLARHLTRQSYRRVASYKPDGRRRDYWTFRRSAKLSALGDVTLILSKRRFNDPPRQIKLLVTNLREASTCEILTHFARRWMVEVTFKELKTGLHLGQMQVTKEEQRIQRSVALPVMAYLLLLRLYGLELKLEQSVSLFALKQRFVAEAYEGQMSRIEARCKQKLKCYKHAA
jgi:Transposase DDE domain